MTQHPIYTLPPAELRGYARGLRETAAMLTGTGLGLHDAASRLVIATREAWEREAALVQGFAARLGAMEADAEPDDASEDWRGLGERIFPPPGEVVTKDEEENPITFWLAADPEAGHFETAEDAAQIVPVGEIAEIARNGWLTTRWVTRLIVNDRGDVQTLWADSEDEMQAYLAGFSEQDAQQQDTFPLDATTAAQLEEMLPQLATELTPAEAAQEGFADTVAESLATPAKTEPAALRSDSPWTEERLALLARIYPTIMSLEAMREALMALPGLEIATADAVKMKAQRLDLHRRGQPIPEEFADAAAVRVRNLGGLANNGGKPGTWTPERVALLRRDYPGKRPLAEILTDVNALPGPAVPTIEAVAAHAKKVGLSRRQIPDVGPAIPGPPEVMTTEDKAEARERLRTGQAKGARDIMEWFGCTQEEAQEIVDAHRARMGKAA